MKHIVIKPVYPPPKLRNYHHLSAEAQVTLAALEKKYNQLMQTCMVEKTPAPPQVLDASSYYKSIYNSTFKKMCRDNESCEQTANLSKNYLHLGVLDENRKSHSLQKAVKTPCCVYLQNSTKSKLHTEVILAHRPSDKELTESILSLTQKTSAPDSPCMDFDSLPGSDTLKNMSVVPENSVANVFMDVPDNTSTPSHEASEIFFSSKKELGMSIGLPDQDLAESQINEPVVSNSNLLKSYVYKTFEKSSDMHHVSTNMTDDPLHPALQLSNESRTDENPIPSPAFSAPSGKNSQALSEANFDLNESDFEIDSPLVTKKSYESRAEPEMSNPREESNELILNEESPLLVKTEICSQVVQRTGKHNGITGSELGVQSKCQGDLKEMQGKTGLGQPHQVNAEDAIPSKSKKPRSSFKPPVKTKISTDKKESSQELITVEDISSQHYKDAMTAIESSCYLVLSLLYTDSTALCTTFYTPTVHAKVKGLLILANGKCYLIQSALFKTVEVKGSLLKALSSKTITKTICNYKEFLLAIKELVELAIETALPCTNVHDPCIASWLLDPDHQVSSFNQMCQVAKTDQTKDDNDWLCSMFATQSLMSELEAKLVHHKQWLLFKDIEMELVPILACMEARSISVDSTVFVKFSSILKSKLSRLEDCIFESVGHSFSINSHIQLRQVLYEELKLDLKLPPEKKIGKTSITHLKSTNETSLNYLVDVHPVPALILEYKQLQKLKSTYVDGMLSCVQNGMLKTHWDQTAAATGRLTSSQPNVQAIPKTAITITDYQTNYVIGSTTEYKADINVREPYVSHQGHLLLAADFQQIELRVLAHLSEDSRLLAMFWRPQTNDVFIALTSQWQGKPVESVTFDDREQTKRVVYSVMYGVGKEKLAEYLKVKPDVAKSIMSSFLSQFPAIVSFTKKCCDFAKEFGFTETVCGRRRYFPHINSPSPVLRAQAQRQAVNFCVQGSAADICKLAMIAVEKELQMHKDLVCRLLLQIHDELIWEVQENHLAQAKELIQRVMENTSTLCSKFCNLQVPLTVSLNSGKSWAELCVTHPQPCNSTSKEHSS